MRLIVPKAIGAECVVLSSNCNRKAKTPAKNKEITNEIIEVMKQIFPFP